MLLLLFKTANICTRCIVHQMRLIVQWNCTIPIQRDYHEVSLDRYSCYKLNCTFWGR